MKAYRTTAKIARSGIATLAGVVLFDEWKVRYLRRDDEAYIEQPDDVKAVAAVALYGKKLEVEPASKLMMELGRSEGGRYMGDEISTADWDSRHERYATPLHGRRKDGQVVPMCWHCEDAAIPYSALPAVREEWHALVARYVERWDIFDDWGMFAYTNGSFKPWGDYLVELDVGIWEQKLDDKNWAAWVNLKREIAECRSGTRRFGVLRTCILESRIHDVALTFHKEFPMSASETRLIADGKHIRLVARGKWEFAERKKVYMQPTTARSRDSSSLGCRPRRLRPFRIEGVLNADELLDGLAVGSHGDCPFSMARGRASMSHRIARRVQVVLDGDLLRHQVLVLGVGLSELCGRYGESEGLGQDRTSDWHHAAGKAREPLAQRVSGR